jgi:hypothetical protein
VRLIDATSDGESDGPTLAPRRASLLTRFLETDNALRGVNGGRQIAYQNVNRYLDNTAFIGLVADAWVGTTMSQSSVLETVIREVIASGRTVAIAVKVGTDGTDEAALDAPPLPPSLAEEMSS